MNALLRTGFAALVAAAALTSAPGIALAQFQASTPNAATNEARALKPGPGLYVVDTSLRLEASRAEKTNKKGESVEAGWHPTRLEFTLWGKVDSADVLVVTWKDGAKTVGTSECQTPDVPDTLDRFQWMDQGQVSCLTDEKSKIVYPRTGTYGAEIALKSTTRTTLLRKISFTVKAVVGQSGSTKVSSFYVDHDYRMRENFAYWADGSLKLRFWLKRDGDSPPPDTGRTICTVDGAPLVIPGPPTPSDVRPDAEGIQVTLDPNANKTVEWRQMVGIVWGDRAKFKTGSYDCQIVASGKLLRTFRFELDKTLRIVPSAEQQAGRDGAIASRSTYIPDVTYGAGADIAFDKNAPEKRAFMGRAWLPKASTKSPSAASPGSGKAKKAERRRKGAKVEAT